MATEASRTRRLPEENEQGEGDSEARVGRDRGGVGIEGFRRTMHRSGAHIRTS